MDTQPWLWKWEDQVWLDSMVKRESPVWKMPVTKVHEITDAVDRLAIKNWHARTVELKFRYSWIP
jgi:hypothetical protein